MSSITSAATFKPGPSGRLLIGYTKYADWFCIALMKVFRWLATIIMVLIVLEVCMRYIFRAPTIWNNDMQLYISAVQRIVGIGYGSMVHMQIVMDIFTAKMSFKAFKALEIVHYAIFQLPLMIVLVYVTGARSLLTFGNGEKYYSVWRPPLWPVLTAITISYFLFIIQIFSEIIKDAICIQRGDDKWVKERGL